MTDTYYLYKSDKPTKKFTMLMPSHKHIHYFGSSGYRDYTLMNDKKSEFAKEKGGRHTPSSMSKIILWGAPKFTESIKSYEKKFNVKVVFKDKLLTESEKKKLMNI